MFGEEAVLVQERRLHKLRRDAIERRENAIFLVAAQCHPNLVAVAIENATRKADVVHERGFREAEPECAGRECGDNEPRAATRGARGIGICHVVLHFASTTVILPATPRAFRPRSYIDSA